MSESYVYPGFRAFAEKAAAEHDISENQRHRLGNCPIAREIDGALSQLPGQADRERRMLIVAGTTAEVIDRVNAARACLAAQLDAIDAAIGEVVAAISPARRDSEPEPKPKRRR